MEDLILEIDELAEERCSARHFHSQRDKAPEEAGEMIIYQAVGATISNTATPNGQTFESEGNVTETPSRKLCSRQIHDSDIDGSAPMYSTVMLQNSTRSG